MRAGSRPRTPTFSSSTRMPARRASARERRPEAAFLQDRWVQATRDLPESIHHVSQSLRGARPLLHQELLLLRHAGFRGPQLERERDQPLLRPVMKVAFNAAAGLVGRSDDPRAGGRELSTALGVGDGHGHQFGEGEQALLKVVLGAARRCQRTP